MKKIETTKIRKIISIIITLLIITVISIITSKISINIIGNKTIEEYCSTAYQNSVNEYKTCKELNMVQLINKLKEEKEKGSEIPNLEQLKF